LISAGFALFAFFAVPPDYLLHHFSLSHHQHPPFVLTQILASWRLAAAAGTSVPSGIPHAIDLVTELAIAAVVWTEVEA
jgi:hypothetical protein